MNKIIKSAIIRKCNNTPCPFGLKIPFACENVGEIITKMAPIEILGDEAEEDEIKAIVRANRKLLVLEADGKRCPFADKIFKDKKAVECNFDSNTSGVNQKGLEPSKFYSKVYNNIAYDGLYSYPMGWYGDNNISRNLYYGIYSLQGSDKNKLLNIFASAKWKGKVDIESFFPKEKYEKWLETKNVNDIETFLTPPRKVNNLLASLINNPYVFINFSQIPIIGTNYQSYFGSSKKYKTPAGLYAYPIAELTISTANFAKDFKYVSVIKSEPNDTLVFSKYTWEQSFSDLNKLKEKFGQLNYNDRKMNLPIDRVWNYIYTLSQGSFSKFTTAWVYLGYKVLYDDGFSIIHNNEPRQALFLTPKTDAEIISIFENNIKLQLDRDLIASDFITNGFDEKNAKKLVNLIKDNSSSRDEFINILSNNESLNKIIDIEKLPLTFFYIWKHTGYFGSILASSKNVSSEMLSQLAEDPNEYVREDVVNNQNTSPETLSILAKDSSESVRANVAKNPNTPPETLSILAKDVGAYVAGNPNTSPETLSILAKDSSEYVRANVAKNPNTLPETLSILAKDSSEYVRENVAVNPNTPPEILSILAKDSSENVRENVAKNPNTLPEILSILAKDSSENVRADVAKNLNTLPEILSILAKDLNNNNVRADVAKNPNTLPEILSILAKDLNNNVRANVAKNQNTPLEILSELVKDSIEYVREYAVKNPNTSPETLSILAKDSRQSVRADVAKNPNTLPETLSILAKDSSENVRADVAVNPNTSSETLSILAKDSIEYVRADVAKNLNTLPETLSILAKDSKQSVRVYVAKNPNTLPETLSILAKDSSESVRANVVKNPNTPTSELASTIADKTDTIADKIFNFTETYLQDFHKNPQIKDNINENIFLSSLPNLTDDVVLQLIHLDNEKIWSNLEKNINISNNMKDYLKKYKNQHKYDYIQESIEKKANFLRDIKDAAEHAMQSSQFTGTVCYKIIDIGEINLNQILSWDDYSSWGEFSNGELVHLSKDELEDTLNSFRPGYYNLVKEWIKDPKNPKFPPIILVETLNEGDMIGDGRGRVSVAVGLNIKTLPCIVMKETEDEGECFEFEDGRIK